VAGVAVPISGHDVTGGARAARASTDASRATPGPAGAADRLQLRYRRAPAGCRLPAQLGRRQPSPDAPFECPVSRDAAFVGNARDGRWAAFDPGQRTTALGITDPTASRRTWVDCGRKLMRAVGGEPPVRFRSAGERSGRSADSLGWPKAGWRLWAVGMPEQTFADTPTAANIDPSRHHCSFWLNASRSPSPIRLKASTVTKIANPGNHVSQSATPM